METVTIYENGNAFNITIQKAEKEKSGKKYILINDILHEVKNKVKINEVNVNGLNASINEFLANQ